MLGSCLISCVRLKVISAHLSHWCPLRTIKRRWSVVRWALLVDFAFISEPTQQTLRAMASKFAHGIDMERTAMVVLLFSNKEKYIQTCRNTHTDTHVNPL